MNPPRTSKLYVLALGLILAPALASRAQFTPIPLTSDSFNQDIFVENTARSPVLPATTACMDTGTTNIGYAWFERGYHPLYPVNGLAAPGAIFTSDAGAYHDFRMAPSYKTNNVILIDRVLTNGTLTFAAPAAVAKLSFLVSGGNGGGTIGVKVYFQDGIVQTATCVCRDWLDGFAAAYTSYGRVNVNTFTFADLSKQRPGIYYQDLDLTHSGSAVTRVEFNYLGGDSHNAVFAISGAEYGSAMFNPIEVSGYNADVIVEADAVRNSVLSGVTTATIENGQGGVGWAWYQEGYYPPAPASGFPSPGDWLTNAAAPDHVYRMQALYTRSNAVVLDGLCASAMVTPATPVACGALSFLGAAGHGPVTLGAQFRHADGTVETNWFSLPDWMGGASSAFDITGRVELVSSLIDSTTTSHLFSADVVLTNAGSPVTAIWLNWAGNASNSRAVLLALSAAAAAQRTPPRLNMLVRPDGALRLTSSGAGELQSATALHGAAADWKSEGPIAAERVLQPLPGEPFKFYRVLAH